MRKDTKTRLFITGMLYPMINAILFGTGAVAVLSIPALDAVAALALPAVIASALGAALPISWILAPRMRLRHWQSQQAAPGFPLR